MNFPNAHWFAQRLKTSIFPSPLLLSAIAIEGYAVLAVELLAIRQLTPMWAMRPTPLLLSLPQFCSPWHLAKRLVVGRVSPPAMR
jgi:hypothetical protein